MAEAPDPVEKGLEELEEEITCPVCQEHFRDPKILASTTTARSASDNWLSEQGPTTRLRVPSAKEKKFYLKMTPINCPRLFLSTE